MSQNKGSPEKCAVKTPSHEENQPRKRLDPSAQEDLQEKMWDVGERGFLPAMDPVKDLPSPWDELVKIMDYVPSFSVQGHGGLVFSRKLRERVLLKNVCAIDHQQLTTAT